MKQILIFFVACRFIQFNIFECNIYILDKLCESYKHELILSYAFDRYLSRSLTIVIVFVDDVRESRRISKISEEIISFALLKPGYRSRPTG